LSLLVSRSKSCSDHKFEAYSDGFWTEKYAGVASKLTGALWDYKV
jgi:hypothetical protein